MLGQCFRCYSRTQSPRQSRLESAPSARQAVLGKGPGGDHVARPWGQP